MKVAVAGGTGFIGRHLVRHLLEQGDEPVVISRRPARGPSPVRHLTWDLLEHAPEALEGIDAIVNLAGESINQRWTKAAKHRILLSRTETAKAVARMVERLKYKPKTVLNGSGISIYGSSLAGRFDESSPARITDFLAAVVEEWERAADGIRGTRLVKLRTGIVLGADGGAFPLMILPYKLGFGGRIGSGRQWLPWIHIEDMVRAIRYCLINEEIEGPVNCTAPHPVTMDEFGRTVGRVLNRPHWFPVPAGLLKMALGEMSVLLLEGQHAIPRKLLDHGFTFRYPALESAIQELVQRR